MLTPNHLDVFIHCYVSPVEHERLNAPAVKEAIGFFLHEGMIKPDDHEIGVYHTTDKGEFWLNAVLSVPLPVETYMIPNPSIDRGDNE